MKYAADIDIFGDMRDKFIKYCEDRPLEEKFEAVARVKDMTGVELGFPAIISDRKEVVRLLETHGLAVSAVNVNLKADHRWKNGALTALDPSVRREAIGWLKEAMDIAADLDCGLITACLLHDGHDYCFQRDYEKDWSSLVDGIREAASHRADVQVSLEYKQSEPIARTIVSNVGKALYLCTEVGKENVGVTLDIGHALYAGENPSEAMALLVAAGRLFYIHLNDNVRQWDWDMIPGYVNFWDYLELFYYLKKYDYRGWIGTDVFPKYLDAEAVLKGCMEFARNIEVLVGKLEEGKLRDLMAKNDVPGMFSYLQETVLNVGTKKREVMER